MHRSQNGIGYTFDAKDRSVHSMIDLIQTPAGTIADIMENAAHVFDLGSPRVNDGAHFTGNSRDAGAEILDNLV